MPTPENTGGEVRTEGGKFAPGKSGNPGGRPKGWAQVRDLARQHTEEAMTGLLKLAREAESEQVRRQAWADLLDRAWGKPTVGTPDEEGAQVQRVEYAWAKPE